MRRKLESLGKSTKPSTNKSISTIVEDIAMMRTFLTMTGGPFKWS